MEQRLVVGRVAKAHGIRGEVSVEILTDHVERFSPGCTLGCGSLSLTVASSRQHQGRMLVRFDEIPDRNGAEELRGAELTVPAEDAKPLPEGRWYPHQLEGLDVRLDTGELVGQFVEVLHSPAHDLWVVRRSDGGRAMIPVPFVTGVDLDAKLITVSPPEGLL